MSWTDRDYNQSKFGGGGGLKTLVALLNWSVPLGAWWDIQVRISSWFFFFAAGELIYAGMKGGMGYRNALTEIIVLFVIVLLHEFGHCFACRRVGGTAREILMWPLGGLAAIESPHRPLPSFISVAGGPFVNVLICLAAALLLFVTGSIHSMTLLDPFHPLMLVSGAGGVGYYAAWFFILSYINLLFNLLPVYPLDGGNILQTILWPKYGYIRAMNISCIVGIVGGGVMMAAGLFLSSLIFWVGLCGILACMQMRAQLRAQSFQGGEPDAMDFSESLRPDPPVKRHKINERRAAKLRRLAQEEHAEQERIDVILAKVSANGMASLNWFDRRMLHRATARQRKRDAERLRTRRGR